MMFVLHVVVFLASNHREREHYHYLPVKTLKQENNKKKKNNKKQPIKSRAPAPLWYVFDPSFLRRSVSLIEIAPPKYTSRQADRRSITALQLVGLSSSAHLRVSGVNAACPYLIHRHHLPSSVIINFKSSD